MLEVHVPGRRLEDTLRVVKAIAIRTLASEGYVLCDPVALVYRLLIEERPERLYIELKHPVAGLILGTWNEPVDPFDGTLSFEIKELDRNPEGAIWPFSDPPAASSPSATRPWLGAIARTSLDELLFLPRPSAPLPAPLPAPLHVRPLRVIDLD